MPIIIQRLNADGVLAHQPALIDLLRDVVDGGASVNFIAPLDTRIAAAFWERVAGEVASNARVVIATFDADQLVGTAQLVLAMQPNGLHRAEVQKVLVRTSARRRGIGTQMMVALEDEARAVGRSLLVLDTERGSSGEQLYPRVGYTRVGVIPQFALNHDASRLIDAVFFYKLI